MQLFASTRQAELAPLAPEQRAQFAELQQSAQRRSYRARFPGSDDAVIEVDGRPVGRLWLNRSEHELRVVDITLLPEHRGRGLGTSVLRTVHDEARELGRPVVLSVFRDDQRALSFYRRLGFAVTASTQTHWSLRWPAAQPGG